MDNTPVVRASEETNQNKPAVRSSGQSNRQWVTCQDHPMDRVSFHTASPPQERQQGSVWREPASSRKNHQRGFQRELCAASHRWPSRSPRVARLCAGAACALFLWPCAPGALYGLDVVVADGCAARRGDAVAALPAVVCRDDAVGATCPVDFNFETACRVRRRRQVEFMERAQPREAAPA